MSRLGRPRTRSASSPTDVKAPSDRVDKVAKQSQSAASSDNAGTDEQARSSIDKLDQRVQTLS